MIIPKDTKKEKNVLFHNTVESLNIIMLSEISQTNRLSGMIPFIENPKLRVGVVAQWLSACLPQMLEALGSILSTTLKK